MKDTRRATKIYLKHLPPVLAEKLVDKYKIPSPEREVLLSACVVHKGGFAGVEYLKEKYEIYMSYWAFARYLATALDRFYESHLYFGGDYSRYLQ